ncbi:MAG: hypothetical protein JWP01_915 [Myxococcales bacterium]|nr:hypothetical protein [Myxococcales bacterium]
MMTRKDFLRSLVGAGAATLGVAMLAGCGGDDGDGGGAVDAAPRVCTSPSGSISGNHGHVVTVPLADVNAGADKTYDITGTSAHAHSITVTAANFTTIQGSGSVTLTSTSGGGHTHVVTVQCIS